MTTQLRRFPRRHSPVSPGPDLRLATEGLLRDLDEPETAAAESSWITGYLDVLLLLLTLFAVLLGLSYLRSAPVAPQESPLLGVSLELSRIVEPQPLDPQLLKQAVQTLTPLTEPVAAPPPAPEPAAVPLDLLAGMSFEPQPAALEPQELEQVLQRVAQAADERLDLSYDQREIRLEVRDDILFPLGSAELGAEGRALLTQLAGTLATEDLRISVEGHTDDLPIATERFPSNWELSSFRATTVARHLIGQGVPETRIRITGYADTRPRVANDSPANRARNRRVSIVLHRAEAQEDGPTGSYPAQRGTRLAM
jgi:chemotaxis protein MotB